MLKPLPGLILLIPLALAAQDSTVSRASISGRVLNALTGEPVRRVSLTLRPDHTPGQDQKGYAAVSAEDGSFRIGQLPAGAYWLAAESPAYARATYSATGRTRRGEMIRLEPGQTRNGLVFLLQPLGVIAGRVLDEAGEPVMLANVVLAQRRYENGRWRLAVAGNRMTQDTGEFRFPFLRPGRYLISASAPSHPTGAAAGGKDEVYAQTYHPNAPNLDGAAELRIGPGTQLEDIEIRLLKSPVFQVLGVFEGSAVSSNSVWLMRRDGDGSELSLASAVTMDADGRFVFPRVSPGNYRIAVPASSDRKIYRGAADIVVAQEDLEHVVVPALAPASVRGRVHVEGAPAAYSRLSSEEIHPFEVTLLAIEEPPLPRRPTSVRVASLGGEFEIGPVNGGRYTFRCRGGALGAYLKSVRVNGETSEGGAFHIQAGATADLELTFAFDSARVRGVVTGVDGQALPGAVVTVTQLPLIAERPNGPRSANSNPEGIFHLDSLAPGEYLIQAWEDIEDGAQFDPETQSRAAQWARRVTLSPGEQAELDLIAAPAAAALGY